MPKLEIELAALNDQHRAALQWFHERQGQEIGWPARMSDGLFLANKAKGIHKPLGWAHALSVRQTMGGPYADREPSVHPDGSWHYDYAQEGHDPGRRDEDFTNRALMQNVADDVPVGVMIQVKKSPNPRYKVLGLGKVESWAGGYFRLRGYTSNGELGKATAPNSTDIIIAAVDTLPTGLTDARKRINAAIVARQGAGKYRSNALAAFHNRCAISGSDVPDVLEAAHIVPYLGPDTNKLANTLLLRADLHTLFDRDLLTIDPATLRVKLAPSLLTSSYSVFEGVEVKLPAIDVSPWQAALKQRQQHQT